MIEEELAFGVAGFRGEKSLNYYLEQLEKNGQLIFQALRLPHSKDDYFQMDVLIISLRYFVIIEAKNIAGTLFIDQNQMIRTLNGKEDSFPNPIQQVENQQYHFINYLNKHLEISLPNTSFVAMTNSSSIIKPNPQYRAVAQKVIRPNAIRQRVDSFSNSYPKDLISKKELQKLSRVLLKHHTVGDPDIMGYFSINKNEILTGSYCDTCNQCSIIRVQRQWKCSRCGIINKKAHIHALIDYCLLMGSTITNKQCRNFLQLSSSSIASKLLRSLNLPFTGEYKNRVYHLALKDLQKWL